MRLKQTAKVGKIKYIRLQGEKSVQKGERYPGYWEEV
jgi:hypothetical protein